jgi:FAD/FMN-containing dehydrogenase
MADRKAELVALVAENGVVNDNKSLESFSSDKSFARMMKPDFVVKPANMAEIQKIVQWANRTKTPLIPVSSGPPHFHGDTVPGVPGAVIVDLSGMKKIININRRNRMAIIEPGVTYGQLQPELAQKGMRISPTLLPRANKSIITSLLEREPRLNSRYQWSSMDPLRSMEVIWGDGNKLWTGGAGFDVQDLEKQIQQEKYQNDPTGPGQTDFYRLLAASQGSMGIATWAAVRCEVLPQIHKLFFAAANKLEDLVDFTYRILKFRYADEVFLLNGTNLAYILGHNPAEVKTLKEKLPSWLILVGIAGRVELPEERVNYQEADIREIAHGLNLELSSEVPGATSAKVLEVILKPSREPYWKTGYKGSWQDIFFISTLDRIPEFVKTMFATAEASGYPASDIGIYIQPRQQGVNCHCEFNLPYTQNNPQEVSRVQKLFDQASKALFNQGAFFTRPYGSWANMAYSKDPASANLLQKIKGIFDPQGIMNPGKLCFKVKEMEER